MNLGLKLAGAGEHQAAVEQYRRALAIDPHLGAGYYYLGRALSALGRREEALAALESAAALEPPQSPRRYLLRAEVHVARQEWSAALAAFGQAAELVPEDPVPHYRLGWVLAHELEDAEAATAHFQWALQLDPDYVPPRLALARLYAEREECDQAADWLAPLLAPDAGEGLVGQAHTLLGQCLLQQGREREGLGHLEQAAALHPESVPYLVALARGYVQAARYHDAIEIYLRALELDPGNAQARQALEELGWFETLEDALEDGR